jgi:hypothetical protein
LSFLDRLVDFFYIYLSIYLAVIFVLFSHHNNSQCHLLYFYPCDLLHNRPTDPRYNHRLCLSCDSYHHISLLHPVYGEEDHHIHKKEQNYHYVTHGCNHMVMWPCGSGDDDDNDSE